MTIARFINTVLLWLTLLAFGAQLFIGFSTENIAVGCIILASSLTTILYFRWSNALETHPLSSFAIFGFCVSSQLGALLTQSASWTAVSYRLRQPEVTFSTLFMYLIIALIAHVVYRMVTTRHSSIGILPIIRSIFARVEIYTVPPVIQLWIMALIGTFSLLISFNPVAKGISFLAWLPFLIPLYVNQQQGEYCNTKLHYPLLFLHAMLIVLIGLTTNARQVMLSGFVTVAFLFLLSGMRSTKLVKSSLILKIGSVGLLALVLSWPVSDLMTAMVVARDTRAKVSTTKLVENTMDAFQHPEVLEKSRAKQRNDFLYKAYDETYLTNPILSRFVETKFHDNALYFASRLSEHDAEAIWKLTNDVLLGILPQPVLDLLKIKINKEELHFSMGDQLAHYAIGTPMGGYRIGSAFAHGEVLFGALFPIVYFFICFALFVSMDILVMPTKTGVLAISAIGMLKIWPIFLYGLNADSLSVLFGNVFRVMLQSVILYAIVFYIAKSLSNLVLNIKTARASALLAK